MYSSIVGLVVSNKLEYKLLNSRTSLSDEEITERQVQRWG